MIHPHELNRFATFVVSAEMVRDHPMYLMTCMTGMVVLGATPNYSNGTIEYVVCGPMFDVVPIEKLDGRRYPEYACVFDRSGNFVWEPIGECDCEIESH